MRRLSRRWRVPGGDAHGTAVSGRGQQELRAGTSRSVPPLGSLQQRTVLSMFTAHRCSLPINVPVSSPHHQLNDRKHRTQGTSMAARRNRPLQPQAASQPAPAAPEMPPAPGSAPPRKSCLCYFGKTDGVFSWAFQKPDRWSQICGCVPRRASGMLPFLVCQAFRPNALLPQIVTESQSREGPRSVPGGGTDV